MRITDRDEEFKATITFYFQKRLGRDPDPEGLQAWLENARNGMTGEQIDRLLAESPEGKAFAARPPAPKVPPLPTLRVEGRHFFDERGPIVLVAIDQFRAYDRYLNGEDLAAIIEETHTLGAFVWRVFLMADSFMKLGPSRPGYYEGLGEFATFLNRQGIVLHAVVLADAQVILPKTADQQAHAERIYAILRGTGALVSLANEFGKNGVNVGAFPQPAGLIWSRGSGLADQAPPTPYGSFAEFHPRRDMPAMLYDTVATPGFLYSKGLPCPLYADEPIGFDEADQANRRSSDPDLARRLASHYAIEWDGLCFHSSAGIQSTVLGPQTRRCADAWFEALYRCSGMTR
jgi:hypothetical protein